METLQHLTLTAIWLSPQSCTKFSSKLETKCTLRRKMNSRSTALPASLTRSLLSPSLPCYQFFFPFFWRGILSTDITPQVGRLHYNPHPTSLSFANTIRCSHALIILFRLSVLVDWIILRRVSRRDPLLVDLVIRGARISKGFVVLGPCTISALSSCCLSVCLSPLCCEFRSSHRPLWVECFRSSLWVHDLVSVAFARSASSLLRLS